jgi:hypothetical protein
MIHSGLPLLGIRMLCPRYNLATAFKIMATLAEQDNFLSLPRFPKQLLDYIIKLDYQRTRFESANRKNIMVDIVGDTTYCYALVSVHKLIFFFCTKQIF